MASIKLLAIDQSTTCVGWCMMDTEELKLLAYGECKIAGKSVEERIHKVKDELTRLIDRHQPEVFAVEDIQFQTNYQVYKTLAMLLGVVQNLYFERRYLWLTIPPKTWKAHCGISGRARKEQKANTISMVKEKYNIEVSEDTADAIGIAIFASTFIFNG